MISQELNWVFRSIFKQLRNSFFQLIIDIGSLKIVFRWHNLANLLIVLSSLVNESPSACLVIRHVQIELLLLD